MADTRRCVELRARSGLLANGRREYNPAEQIQTAAEVSQAMAEKQRRFSAFRLSDGTFWDNPENFKLARVQRAAHRRLIDAVVGADRELGGNKHPVLRRLLLLTVLIKYLEDRGVFPHNWFDQFHKGTSSFLGVLQQGTPDEVRELLDKLEHKFNGDVFSLPETQERLTTRSRQPHDRVRSARSKLTAFEATGDPD